MLVARAITVPLALVLVVCALLIPLQAGVAEAQAKPTIAVSYFENNTGDDQYAPLGRGLADMLITDLSNLAGAQIVERARLNLLLQELELSKSPFIDPATAAKMGRGLGAHYIVTGSFVSIEPRMRIDARIVEVASGKVVHSADVQGPISEFFLLEKELALTLAKGIGITLTAKENAKLGRVATDSFEAFSAWSEGLEAIDGGEIELARRALDKALENDGDFGPAVKMLGKLKTTTEDLSSRRHAMLVSDAASIIKALKKLKRKKSGAHKDVFNVVDFRAVDASLPSAAREAKEIARLVMDLKIPDSVTFGAVGYQRPVNSWAMGTYFMASYHLRAHADVVTYGQAFMKRYPRGSYFRAIESIVNATVADLRRAREGRQRTPAIKEAANVRRLELLCRYRRDLDQKVRDCAGFVSRIAASKTAEKRERRLKDGIKSLMDAVKATPTLAALALAQSTIRGISKDRDVLAALDSLKTFTERRQAAADRAPAEVQNVTCGRHPQRALRLAACRQRAQLSLTLDAKRLESAISTAAYKTSEKGYSATEILSGAAFLSTLAARLPKESRVHAQIAQLRQVAATRKTSGDKAAKMPLSSRNAAIRAADELWAAGRVKQAKRVVSTALRSYPNDSNLTEVLVQIALDEGDLRTAKRIADAHDSARAKAGEREDKRISRMVESHSSKFVRHEESLAKAHAKAAEAFFEAGKRREARERLGAALRRFPSNTALNSMAVYQAEEEGDRAAAMKALAHWTQAAGLDAIPSRAIKRAEEIPTDLETRRVESQVQDELAHALAKAAQWQQAADLFLQIARDFPKGHSPEEDSLNDAAKYYRLCGKIKKSRELYTELATRFGGTRRAELASSILMQLPN
jgi:TolB-like protein